jgi:hypothetical protein
MQNAPNWERFVENRKRVSCILERPSRLDQGARLLNGQPDETRQAARAAVETFFMEHEGPEG